MARYEYKLVAAPVKATRHKGLKGADAFAATLQDVMNDLGAEGWSYLRSDILPEDIRSGLTARTTVYRTILVFQRCLVAPAPADQPPPAAAMAPAVTAATHSDKGDDEEAPALANLLPHPDLDPDLPPRG